MAYYIEYHKKRDTWNTKVDKFIVLTEFSKNIFSEFGIHEHKIVTKPNFTLFGSDVSDETKINKGEKLNHYFLYVGRLSNEKGIYELVKNWKSFAKLKVIGDGPLHNSLKKLNNKKVDLIGKKNKITVFEYMKNAHGLIFPSVCYEGFPLVLVEAMFCGLPVITSNIGNQATIIHDMINGLHVNLAEPEGFSKAANRLLNDKKLQFKLSQGAVNQYKGYYTSEKNYQKLIQIYQDVISSTV